MNNPKRITICADDFAFDEGTSLAILELAAAGRISATSCMTRSPIWKDTGRELQRHRDRVLIGLHFDLTEGFGHRGSRLGRIILASLTRRLDPAVVTSMLRQQIEQFTDVAGVLPDYIDGHHHVHAFPVVASVVRQTAEIASPRAPIPIRSVSNFFGPTDARLKRAVIRGLAALGDRASTDFRQIRLNTGFTGDYSLGKRADFSSLFQTWLEKAPDRALVMCHPSKAPSAPSARVEEYRFLSSSALTNLLEWHSIRFLQRHEIDRRAFATSTSMGLAESALIE